MVSKNKVDESGMSWREFEATHFTPMERAIGDVRVSILKEIINARLEHGVTQTQLGEMSGIRQPVIARLERGVTDPQLSTVLKILFSLGKTLEVVPLPPQDS